MTSHIVDVLADTTPIQHLDFVPPCEGYEWCGQTATWIAWRVQCCDAAPPTVLLCEGCRRRIWAACLANCLYCQVVEFLPAHTAFYRCERLRGDT